jgi:hypothetical protein
MPPLLKKLLKINSLRYKKITLPIKNSVNFST